MNDRLFKILMKCGHIANSTKQIAVDDEIPYCVICDCDEIDEIADTLDITNRKAQCSYCGKIIKSEFSLPFFLYRPDQEYDEYYCGCGGWD